MEELLAWFAKETAQHLILHYLSYLGALFFIGGGLVLGVLMFGRRYKQRIAALEAQVQSSATVPSNQGVIIQNIHGNVTLIQSSKDDSYRARYSGEGEIVSPHPVRVIEVEAGDELGISESVEAVLIPGDKKGDPPK